MKKTIGTCRHCTRTANLRSRQLCYRCYATPAIKALYPSKMNYVGDRCGPSFRPKRKTSSLPGSPEKIRVLRERMARGESLFDERDKAPCLK